MNLTAVALWMIAIGVVWCACLLVGLIWQTKHAERLVEIQLQGLNHTHMLAFEALTTLLERLEKRIKIVEDEVL